MSTMELSPRKRAANHRRISIYVSWSFPAEVAAPLHELDNRFSAMWEVRRVLWPNYEWAADPDTFLQGIDGTLQLFFRDWEAFQVVGREASGHPVHLFQRVDFRGRTTPLDERILDDADTVLVFSLDHQATRQEATPDEIAAVRRFLTREGTCLVLGPHHDVGKSDDFGVRDREYQHHGDPLVPRQQRFGTYGLSLLRALGIPVENRYGLNPARAEGTKEPAPLSVARDLDELHLFEGVSTLTLHPHLPHYFVADEGAKSVRVLATHPVNPHAPPHPSGTRDINVAVWAPPGGERAGDVLVIDSTQFTASLFGSSDSLKQFWCNLATMRSVAVAR